LLSAITDLGLALGSRMVAEGVETQAQLETVQNAGCDIIQGYFYSKPIALAELA
jgi:EAL domain-containing protein (putative c-di-GMP-specific phosphodiesterase class I)